MITPHKHAALIKQCADDVNLQVWVWAWASNTSRWTLAAAQDLILYPELTYALGDKPTAKHCKRLICKLLELQHDY